MSRSVAFGFSFETKSPREPALDKPRSRRSRDRRSERSVFHAYQTLFAEMNHVVSELSRGRDRGHRDTHVGEEVHAAVGANG